MPLGRMTIFQQKWKINTIMNFGRSVIKKKWNFFGFHCYVPLLWIAHVKIIKKNFNFLIIQFELNKSRKIVL